MALIHRAELATEGGEVLAAAVVHDAKGTAIELSVFTSDGERVTVRLRAHQAAELGNDLGTLARRAHADRDRASRD